MKAVTIADGELSYAEHDDPSMGDFEILVDVKAAGLNAGDLLQKVGLYPPPAGVVADIPGLELAGEVLSTGGRVTRYAKGDRVMAIVAGGAQAQLCAVDQEAAVPVPDNIPWEQAGGFCEAFATAHDALVSQCRLSMGDRLLVTGAAGGVGCAAIQLASSVGAYVVASARHARLHNLLVELGADAAVLPDEVARFGPYDVILELVGGRSLSECFASLGTGGRISVVGVGGGGSKMEIDLLGLMQRRARMSGSTLRPRPRAEKAAVMRKVEHEVLPLLARGMVRVPVLRTFDMSEAKNAYDFFAQPGKLGKIVLHRS